ncbi:MAG: hemolysin family protein [Spirochaetia bacterium]|nr:hemolysin family protein [Spirochaetia bacterium]
MNEIIILLFLLVVSAFFSGAETAIFSLSHARILRIRESKNKKLIYLKNLLTNPEMVLSVILLGNLSVNIFFSDTAHLFLGKYFSGRQGDIVILIIITSVLLIAGEIIPKILSLRYAETWSLNTAWLLSGWMKISKPVAWPLNQLTMKITSLIPQIQNLYNEAQLLDTLRFALADGIIDEKEYKILQRRIHFYHDTAYSIMVPKSAVTMLSPGESIETARKFFIKNRLPIALIFNEKENRVSGYISARSIIQLLGNKSLSIAPCIQPVIFLPETMLLNEVLEEFMKNHLEVAAIIDEMGEFSGILTIKEIFHTLLGNVDSAFMPHQKTDKVSIFPVNKNTYKVSGTLTLHEFNDYFKTDLVSENSETISGFLIEMLDGYPKSNTSLKIRNMEFSNMKVKNNIIYELLLAFTHE